MRDKRVLLSMLVSIVAIITAFISANYTVTSKPLPTYTLTVSRQGTEVEALPTPESQEHIVTSTKLYTSINEHVTMTEVYTRRARGEHINRTVASSVNVYQVTCPCNRVWRRVDSASLRCALECAAQLRKLAREITGESSSTLDALVKIASWVARNTRYVPDAIEDTVYMPSYVLTHGGDCEDRAYLVLTLLKALYPNATVVIVSYESRRDGHCMPGIMLDGVIYAVPVVAHPYPMRLDTDLCKYLELLVGEEVKKLRLVFVDHEEFVDITVCRGSYPPRLPDLKFVRDALTRLLNATCRANVNSSIALLVPIDWYSFKTPEWIGARLSSMIYDATRGICKGRVVDVELVERSGVWYIRVVLEPP